MKQKSLKELEKQVNYFNQKHQVGSIVSVKNDFEDDRPASLSSEAQVLSGHSAVVWLDGVKGCISLDRIV